MLRCILRVSGSAATSSSIRSSPVPISAQSYSSKDPKSNVAMFKKTKSKAHDHASASEAKVEAALSDAQSRARLLAEDEKDPSLDFGPDGRPLFTSTPSLSLLSRKDACSYFKFSMDGLKTALPEGLPTGMVKEFEDSLRPALLVRQSFLDLRDNFRRIVDPPLHFSDDKGLKLRKQIVLDGPSWCGKSIALAMLVHWARDEGWLVFYVPRGQEWTHGGFFSKNPETGHWDTPRQAANVLKDFLKWNKSHLKQLPCQIDGPIPLGEGAGVGWLKDVDNMAMPEGSTLYGLVNTGIKHTHAAVGVVVRLRRELSLVKNIPVLIAIDQYNSWFTFSDYEEAVTIRYSRPVRRPVHAGELAMVNAFRSMMHDDMMVGALSRSTLFGNVRAGFLNLHNNIQKDLPDVPVDARVNFPLYSLDEAATVCHYYLRQRLVNREVFSEENWKEVYRLSKGNGAMMRWLVGFMQQST